METYNNIFIYEFMVNKIKFFHNLLIYVCKQYIVSKYLIFNI